MARNNNRNLAEEGERLRNQDYTDRELLLVIADVADTDGFASSYEVAIRLGRKSRMVSSRLGWMARRDVGFLGRVSSADVLRDRLAGDTTSFWRITPLGEQIMAGKLSKTVQTALEQLRLGEQVLAMREISRRGVAEAESYGAAAAVRREYLHQISRRSRS